MRSMSSSKKKVEESWDKISSTYDEQVRAIDPNILTSYNRLFQEISIPENPITLDVGCGTGTSTFELAKKCNRKGLFHGMDLSQKMIEVAEQKATRLGYDNCVFSQGDAEELDYSDSTFDLVTSSHALHLVPDKLKALSEMYRVLKPGGLMALIYSGEGHLNEVFSILKGLEDKYPEWFKDYSWDEVCNVFISLERSHELFAQVGFENIRVYARDEINFVEPSRAHGKDYVFSFWQEDLPSDRVLALKKEMVDEIKERSTNFGFKQTFYYIYAHCTKPL